MTTIPYPALRAHHGRLELIGRVPTSVPSGHRVACEWELVNHDSEEVAVSFYLRVAPSRLASLVCPSGRAQRGHGHGSAAVLIPAGEALTISALLEPASLGDQPVCVAVVTRYGTCEQTDIVTVRQQLSSPIDRVATRG
jgi:hypothetical protein